jgi:hypothetical protein
VTGGKYMITEEIKKSLDEYLKNNYVAMDSIYEVKGYVRSRNKSTGI